MAVGVLGREFSNTAGILRELLQLRRAPASNGVRSVGLVKFIRPVKNSYGPDNRSEGSFSRDLRARSSL